MRCRSCNSENTRVTCTDKDNPEFVKRYCRCLDCAFRFRTVERYEVLKPKMPIGFSPNKACDNPMSTLTKQDVLMIRHLHQKGLSNGQLAIRFKQNRSTISRIVNYKTYASIK
jgi:transcriptional regulator NrdR family protein